MLAESQRRGLQGGLQFQLACCLLGSFHPRYSPALLAMLNLHPLANFSRSRTRGIISLAATF